MAVFTLTPASRAFWRAAALQAARKLDLGRHLLEPRSCESLAAALGAGAPRLQKLLDALALEGAVSREGDRYPHRKSKCSVEKAPGARPSSRAHSEESPRFVGPNRVGR